MLQFANQPALTLKDFLSRCVEFIPRKDASLIKEALSTDGYALQVSAPATLLKWREFDLVLRNELVKARALRKKVDPAGFLRNDTHFDMKITHIAQAALRHTSILEAERYLDLERWNALDEISAGSKPKKERKEKKEGIEKKFTFQFKAIEIPAHVKRTALLIAAALLAFWLLVSFVRFVASHIPKGGPKKSARSVEAAAPVVQARPQVSKDVTASLTAKRNCYVKVKVDGKMLYSGLISRGKVETWKGSREIEFRISDGSAVYLEVNGKSLPPLTSMRKLIKSLKVTSSGISVSK